MAHDVRGSEQVFLNEAEIFTDVVPVARRFSSCFVILFFVFLLPAAKRDLFTHSVVAARFCVWLIARFVLCVAAIRYFGVYAHKTDL